MRIAVLSWESLHSIPVGGVASHVTELAAALQRRGHDPHVFTRMASGQRHHDCIDGVHYHRCPYPPHPEFVDDINNMCRAMVERVFAVEDMAGRFDVVHAHDWLTANAMIWIKQGRGHRTLLTIHATEYARCGNTFPGGRSARVRDQERAGTYWADRVITVSHASRDELRWMYEVPDWKIDVIYNGVSPHRFDREVDAGQVKGRHRVGPLDPMVLFCGRLEWQKGPDLLVEAIPHVLRAHGAAKFVFVGDGGMRGQLERRAGQLGVAGSVRFLGYRDGDELVDLFKAADVVCVPSRNEPFGIVVLEAWSAGKPVVVTQSGGPNEYVTHERDGLKIHPRPDSVAWGLARIFADFEHARWMGSNGRLTVEQRFTWDIIAEQVIPIYRAQAAPAVVTAQAEQSADVDAALTAAGAAPADQAAALGEEGQPAQPAHVWARLWVESAESADAPDAAVMACCRAAARSGLRPQRHGQAVVVEGDAGAVTEAVRACYQEVGSRGRLRVSILPVLPREDQPLRLVTLPALGDTSLKVRRPPGQPAHLTIIPRRYS